jgi:DNA-binding NarL/FixJ family response regulator
MESRSLRFLILEDHPEVAQNNEFFLQKLYPDAMFTLAETHAVALEHLQLETYDLAIIDLLFGTPSGEQSARASLELLETIFQEYPLQNILIYTGEYSYLKPLTQAIGRHQGGFVVVSKLERRKAFLEGTSHALAGKLEIPRELRFDIELNERETQVITLLCQESLTDKAIACRLNLSLKTVQNCIQRLKIKLDIECLDESITSSRIALCMEAVRRKILVL